MAHGCDGNREPDPSVVSSMRDPEPRGSPHQEAKAGDSRPGGLGRNLTWILALLIVAGVIVAYFVVSGFRSFFDEAYDVLSTGDEEQIRPWVEQFGAWGFLVIAGLMLLQTVVAFLPSLVTMVVSVLAYGPVAGGLLAWAGMLVAASVGYGIGAAVGPAVVDRLVSRDSERKLERFVERYGSKGIIAARISPVLSTDAVSIVAGLVSMSYVKFIAATAAGTVPLTILVAWLGADVNRLWPGLIAVSVISLLTFVGYVIWDRRRSPR